MIVALVERITRSRSSRDGTKPTGGGRVPWTRHSVVCAAVAASALLVPGDASAQNVRLTKLSDTSFGTITNFAVDTVRSQSICVFSASRTNGYNVRATGSGPSNSFALSSGAATLDYEVQWNSSPGQSTGTTLVPNVPLTGLTSTASQQQCNNGPPTSASLILVLRASSVASALAGAYAGTLTLVIAPE